MERHDSMKRAARYLLGAGTLAAAICLVSARPAAAQDCVPIEGTIPLLCGSVTDGSAGQPNLIVQVKDSGGDLFAETTTSTCADADSVCGEYGLPLATFLIAPKSGENNYTICVLAPDGPKCETVTIVADDTSTSVKVDGTLQDSKRTDFILIGDKWGDGTGTPGYWKNHTNNWPIPSVTIGDTPGRQWSFSPTQAAALMGKVGGDKTYTIFASLVSAILNTHSHNNTTCVDKTIADAQHWFSLNGPVGSGVKAKFDVWVGEPTHTVLAGEPLHTLMDDYNNGLLCAPHRN